MPLHRTTEESFGKPIAAGHAAECKRIEYHYVFLPLVYFFFILFFFCGLIGGNHPAVFSSV